MNYLQDSSGNTITIPDNVLLYKGVISFLDFSIRGEYSTDFTIPNDSQTRAVMEFYGINQTDKLVEKPFDLYIDGNKVSEGRVVVRSVADVFDMFFIGGNANWINRITGTLKDLDLSDYDVTFDATTIIARMSATEGVIFPVMDWAYNFKKISNVLFASPITGVSIDTFYDFYPCFYVHTIFKRIFTERGIICAGNLFNDPVFKSVVITPEEIQSAAFTSFQTTQANEHMETTGSCQQFGTNSLVKIQMESGSSKFDNANDRLTFDSDQSDATIIYSLRGGSSSCETANFTGVLYLYKNGSEIASTTKTVSSPEAVSGTFETSISAGDYFELYFRHQLFTIRILEASVIVNASNTVNTDNTVYVSNILPQLDQFAFVRSYASRFNCLADFDDKTQTITFTILDKIRKEAAQDLTDNLVAYEQIPASGYGSLNYLRTTEAEELVNYKTENLNFGDAVIASDGDDERDIFKTIFRPAESFINQNLDWLLTRVPLVKLEDADEGIAYTGVTDTGQASFDIPTNADYFDQAGSIVRLDGTVYSGFMVLQTDGTAPGVPSVTGYGVSYQGNDSGKIYKQKVVFPAIGSRELIVTPSIDVNDINTGSAIYGNQNVKIIFAGSTYPIATIAFAYFAKPNIGTDLDYVRVGLNYGDVINTGNVTFGDLYHKRLNKVVTGSRLNVRLLLTQTKYMNLTLTEFVYLRTKDFEGYFLMDNIDGYRNQYTEVEASLISID